MIWAAPTDAAFRHDRLMIVLRPCAVPYKFQLCTGFTRPFWSVRCRPTEGAGQLPKRTAVAGGPLRYSAIAHSGMMVSFYEPPVVYPAAHRIHAAFLARQVPTSGRRKTVAKTDSRGWTPCSGRPLRRPHLGPFFYELRVTRGDVVILSLLPQSAF